MRFYTTLKLGPHREKTWDGFTLFRNVSIARIGEQVYGANEGIGVTPGPDGMIRIVRKPEQVFRQETLDSGNGKAIVIEHPDNEDERLPDVRPDNWRDLAHGVMFNLRRGTGEQADDCVADVLICSEEAIREIDLGLRQLSVGYNADYYEIEPGRGEQRNIIINHLALVEAGRCGSRCALRDHKPQENTMKTKKSFVDRILAAVRSKDEDEAKKALEEMEHDEDAGGDTHIHVHTAAPAAKAEDDEPEDPTEKRFKSIEDSIAKLADAMKGGDKSRDGEPEEEREERERKERDKARDKARDEETEEELEEETGTADARKAQDSALLADVFDTVKMNAEIIAPGVSIPTFDAKANPKKMFRDCICGLRRRALQQATSDTATAGMIAAVRGRTLDSASVAKLSCGEVRSIFNAVAVMKGAQNNGAVTRDGVLSVFPNPAAKTSDSDSAIAHFKAASAKRWGLSK